MTTDLISKQITPSDIFVPNGLDSVLIGVQAKVDDFNSQDLDIENKKDRGKIRTFAMDVAKSKTFIDKARIKFVKDKKAALKIIDQEGKRFRDKMDEIKVSVRKPLTEWEDAEKARIADEERLKEVGSDHAEALEMHDLFLREEKMKKQQAEMEAKQKELDRQAEKQRLEKERIEREERIKKEAEEKAKRDAETARLEAERKLEEEKNRRIREAEQAEEKRLADIQAEKDRIEKEKQAEINRIKKEQADKERIEQEKKEAEEAEKERLKKIAEKKAANVRHQKSVNNKILKALVKIGVSEDLSKSVISETVKGNVPGLSVNY
jgi:DNA repair exonuclease SbcCD ATPase subunit